MECHRILRSSVWVLLAFTAVQGEARAGLFGDFEPLNQRSPTDIGDDHHPDVALDELGRAVAVWTSTDTLNGAKSDRPDIVFAASSDFGKKWSAPALIGAYQPPKTADARAARIATDGNGVFVAVWESTYDPYTGGTGERSRILMARSADGGKTWSFPAWLSAADPLAGTNHTPKIACDRRRTWIVAWSSRDLGQGDADILYARSTDNGVTWTRPAALNTNALSDRGDDLAPAIASDGAGGWIAAWQSNDGLNGSTRTHDWILFARSTDGGRSFGAPSPLRPAADAGAPDTTNIDDGAVDLASNSQGRWIAVWQSYGAFGPHLDIATASSSDNGRSWTEAQPIYGVERIQLVSEMEPRVATDKAGYWQVLWWREDLSSRSGRRVSRIITAESKDDGASWQGPMLISENAFTDRGNHRHPSVAANMRGDWIAVWDADGALGKDLGAPQDILTARIHQPVPTPHPSDGGVPTGPVITVGGPTGGPRVILEPRVTIAPSSASDPGTSATPDETVTTDHRHHHPYDINRCDCSTESASTFGPKSLAVWAILLGVGFALRNVTPRSPSRCRAPRGRRPARSSARNRR